MNNPNEFSIAVGVDGKASFIYNDELADFLKEGDATIHRVSNVEPAEGGGWTATMLDGMVLGPFALRQEALEAEVAYLKEQMF